MSDRNVQDEARQLIVQGRLDEAAKALLGAWEEKERAGGTQSRLAAGLMRRLTTLEKDVIKGVVSPADADLERNRITDGLLYLADRLTNTSLEMPDHLAGLFAKEDDMRSRPARVRSIGIALAVVLTTVVFFVSRQVLRGNKTPEAFDLKVYLETDSAGQTLVLDQGIIRVKIKDAYFGPKDINREGMAVFTSIPGSFLTDTVTLLPVDLAHRYEVVNQDFPTPGASASRTITFHLVRIPDITIWRGIVLDPAGRPTARAIVEVESSGGVVRDTTGADGRFEVPVPAEEGAKIKVVVWVDGRRRADKRYILSGEKQEQILLGNEE